MSRRPTKEELEQYREQLRYSPYEMEGSDLARLLAEIDALEAAEREAFRIGWSCNWAMSEEEAWGEYKRSQCP